MSDYGHFGHIATRSDQAIHKRAKERQAKQRRLGRQTMIKTLKLDGTCTQETENSVQTDVTIRAKAGLLSTARNRLCGGVGFIKEASLQRLPSSRLLFT